MTHTLTADANIRMRAWDIRDIRERIPDWDDLSRAAKDERLRAARDADPAPIADERVHNVTTVGLHAYIAANLSRVGDTNRNIAKLAVGDGDASLATSAATGLVNQLGEVTISASEVQNGTQLFTSTFIGTNEFNGQTIREVGLKLDDGSLANLAVVPATAKTNLITLTIETILAFGDGTV